MHSQSMLAGSPLTAFLATTNAPRSKTFYLDVLGLRLLTDDQFAVVFDCDGTELRVQKVESFQPHAFTAVGWQVSDIRDTVLTLSNRGVIFERYPFLTQDDLGIWAAPGGAKVAWFRDPDGNLLSLSESAAA